MDIILLMSVNPGFGGQAFIPNTLVKAKEARKMIDESGYDISLEIDGGVGVANIKEIAEAGCASAALDPTSSASPRLASARPSKFDLPLESAPWALPSSRVRPPWS